MYSTSFLLVSICVSGPSTFTYLLTLNLNFCFLLKEGGGVRNVVVTRCGLDGPGLNPGRGDVFRTHSDRPEAHPLHHMKGTGSLCRRKCGWNLELTTHPFLTPPLCACVRCIGIALSCPFRIVSSARLTYKPENLPHQHGELLALRGYSTGYNWYTTSVVRRNSILRL